MELYRSLVQGVAAKKLLGRQDFGLASDLQAARSSRAVPLRHGLGQPALGTQVLEALLGPALHPVVKGPVAADAGDGGPIGLSVHV